MRPITGDCACGGWFMQPKKGRLRARCDACLAVHKKEQAADWYVRTRKNNPTWRALNKKRAKVWRSANREHARLYKRAYYEARA